MCRFFQIIVYSLGMTLYWSVDYHLPQNQVSLTEIRVKKVNQEKDWLNKSCQWRIRQLAYITLLTFNLKIIVFSARLAHSAKWLSELPSSEHVWGHGPSTSQPELHLGGVWITPQSISPASSQQSHQTAGRGCLPRLCELKSISFIPQTLLTCTI